GWRKAPKPATWNKFAELVAKSNPTGPGGEAASSPPEPGGIQFMLRDLGAVFGDGRALDEVRKLALDTSADLSARQAALKTLIDSRTPDLRDICLSLIDTRYLNAVAARGLALFDEPGIGAKLAASYRSISPLERPALLEILLSRPTFAKALLDQIAAGKIL